MPKGDKYSKLQNHLERSRKNELTLTFDEIASISGVDKLPASAYAGHQWWHNPSSPKQSWCNAGYTAHVRLKERKVMFVWQNVSPLGVKVAEESIREYHFMTVEVEHARYRSWVHCYNAFRDHWNDKTKIDLLCLHLAAYLASWGMLRNSFLLNYDYLVHKPIVESLCSPYFSRLFEQPNEKQVDLVMKATEAVEEGYANQTLIDLKGETVTGITDTLKTKILLGVFGCTPAFDKYFVKTVRQYRICSGSFNRQSLDGLWDYYESHHTAFKKLCEDLTIDGTAYPPMKLLDMCCWQVGYESDAGEEYDSD